LVKTVTMDFQARRVLLAHKGRKALLVSRERLASVRRTARTATTLIFPVLKDPRDNRALLALLALPVRLAPRVCAAPTVTMVTTPGYPVHKA
jgi:hypothetical protein